MAGRRRQWVAAAGALALATLVTLALDRHPQSNAEGGLGGAIGFTFSPRQSAYLGVPWREAFVAATSLGPEVIRLGAYWDEIERREGQRDYSSLDWLLDEAEQAGARVILTVGMKAPRWPEYFLPRWLERRLDAPPRARISDDPELRSQVLDFVGATVDRYVDHPVVAAWQVENEPLAPAGPYRWSIGADLLAEEVQLVRDRDPTGRPIVVSLFAQVDPFTSMLPEGRSALQDARQIVAIADVLGLDVYPSRGVRAFGLDLYLNWLRLPWESALDPFREIAGAAGKSVWVLESQAEPWEPARLVNVGPGDPPSMSPFGARAVLGRLRRSGFDHVLLWGVEHWYMRKSVHQDPSWWDAGAELLARGQHGPALH